MSSVWTVAPRHLAGGVPVGWVRADHRHGRPHRAGRAHHRRAGMAHCAAPAHRNDGNTEFAEDKENLTETAPLCSLFVSVADPNAGSSNPSNLVSLLEDSRRSRGLVQPGEWTNAKKRKRQTKSAEMVASEFSFVSMKIGGVLPQAVSAAWCVGSPPTMPIVCVSESRRTEADGPDACEPHVEDW